MENGNKKETVKAIRMKTQKFTFMHVQTMHIVEVKAVSLEGAIAQIEAQWGPGMAELIG